MSVRLYSALGEDDMTDALAPVGSYLTYPAFALGGEAQGLTAPEWGALGVPLLGFDKATVEGFAMPLGSLAPHTWQTFNIYLELLNITGGAGDAVIRVNKSGEGDIDTTVAVADQGGAMQYVRVPSATTFTFDSIGPIGGRTNKGGALVISRVGNDPADTLDGDLHLGAVLVVRVT